MAPHFCQFYIDFIKRGAIGPFWWPLPLQSQGIPCFLVHLSRRLKCTFVIMPSVVNFSHFRLLLWNRWTEFNKTWNKARSQHPLPSLCFLCRSVKQDGCPGLWLAETLQTSPLKPLNWIQRNLTGSKISTSSTNFVFFRLIRKTRWPLWPLIGWDIFVFSSENHWTEFNETWQEARFQSPLLSLCLSGQ